MNTKMHTGCVALVALKGANAGLLGAGKSPID